MKKRLKEVIKKLKEIKLCIKFIYFNNLSNVVVIFFINIFSKKLSIFFNFFVDIFVLTPILIDEYLKFKSYINPKTPKPQTLKHH